LAHELVPRRTAAYDVANAAVAHQQHLLLPGVLLPGVEQEAVRVRRADEASEHVRRAEHVGVHDEHSAVERLPRRPQREDGALAEAHVRHTAHGDAGDARRQRCAHAIVAEAGDHDRVAHTGSGEAVEEPMEQAASGDLDETLRPAARRAEEALADSRGKDDGGHDPGAPSTSLRAYRKRVKSPRPRAPMFATRKASLANAPWPS